MIAVHRHQTIAQRVDAGLDVLTAAIGAFAVEADHRKQRALRNVGERDSFFAGVLTARGLAGPEPDFAIGSAVICDLGPALLGRPRYRRSKIGRWIPAGSALYCANATAEETAKLRLSSGRCFISFM